MFPPDFEPPVDHGTQEARDVQALVESLACYVSKDEIGMDRTEFLQLVAGRILADLGV
jgi:hypothetical protein